MYYLSFDSFLSTSGPFISDADLITIRAQANHYSQQCAALQSQILPDVQKVSR